MPPELFPEIVAKSKVFACDKIRSVRLDGGDETGLIAPFEGPSTWTLASRSTVYPNPLFEDVSIADAMAHP